MKTFFVICLSLITAGTVVAPSDYKLIAHRGGVVEGLYAENSPAAVKEAIDRGYWMIEIDIRETKDGKAVVQHDPDFQRFYDHPGKVENMTLNEIKQLRSDPSNQAPLTLEEMAQLCQGKLQLMLDAKAPHSDTFCEQIETVLKKYDLLTQAYLIGTEASQKCLFGKAKIGKNRNYIKQAQKNGEPVAEQYFLFEHGNELDKETVAWAQKNDITVVPSVNKFHYRDSAARMEEAKTDILWLKEAGVTEFQIDSEFDRWF